MSVNAGIKQGGLNDMMLYPGLTLSTLYHKTESQYQTQNTSKARKAYISPQVQLPSSGIIWGPIHYTTSTIIITMN